MIIKIVIAVFVTLLVSAILGTVMTPQVILILDRTESYLFHVASAQGYSDATSYFIATVGSGGIYAFVLFAAVFGLLLYTHRQEGAK